VEEAEAILKEEVEKLCAWLSSRELVPTIVRLREHFEGIRDSKWREFLEKHKELPEKDKKAVEKLTRDLIGKLLHKPSVNMKEISNKADRFDYARMLNDVFLNIEDSNRDKD
jgi:glutamyl-tRNA reductase